MAKIARPPSPLARRHPFEPPQDEVAAAIPAEDAEVSPADVVQEPPTRPAPKAAQSTGSTRQARPEASESTIDEPKKKSVGIWMLKADQDRLRAVYRATYGTEGYASFSDFALRALLKEAALLEQRYNDGEQWAPVSAGTIPTGRPLG